MDERDTDRVGSEKGERDRRRHCRERADRDDHPPQAAPRPTGHRGFPQHPLLIGQDLCSAPIERCPEEVELPGIELECWRRRPTLVLGEASAFDQVARVPTGTLPLAQRAEERGMPLEVEASLGDPALESLPFGQERFVADLHGRRAIHPILIEE